MNAKRSSHVLYVAVFVVAVVGALLFGSAVPRAGACGGFFCQAVPINQAAEQIIFRQDGTQITAVVLIQYIGEAEDFSWVVPVPANLDSTDKLATGSDVLMSQLEMATRPQFDLAIEGEACPQPFQDFGTFDGSPNAPDDSLSEGDDGVTVVDKAAVGPFDVQIVTSDDPAALSTWLTDNDYDVTDRGDELIEPYVAAGMNFVALKLQQDQGVGDIVPLIMRYESEHPMVPIRLTAVAAEDDMGVIVWVLGSGRAIPLNYLHVIPNYTLLNWYQGTFAAYASYQGLVTAAMNEAGGQGFATDYAGTSAAIVERLPSLDTYEQSLQRLQVAASAQAFYEELVFAFVFPADQVLEILRRQLPLTEGIDEFVYNDPALLIEAVGEQAAIAAQANIVAEIEDGIIAPLEAALDVFAGDPYLTRLYTTLSADEMTLDPEFSFKTDLEDQPLARNATLYLQCDVISGTSWRLELGAGTGREGETVLQGTGTRPFVTPTIDQPNVLRAEFLSETEPADVEIDNSDMIGVVHIEGEPEGGLGDLCGAGTGGCGGVSLLLLGISLLGLHRMRRSPRRKRG